MTDTPLTDQILDIEIKKLLDMGATPCQIVEAVGRSGVKWGPPAMPSNVYGAWAKGWKTYCLGAL